MLRDAIGSGIPTQFCHSWKPYVPPHRAYRKKKRFWYRQTAYEDEQDEQGRRDRSLAVVAPARLGTCGARLVRLRSWRALAWKPELSMLTTTRQMI